ncbi:MAG: hypothetical protein AAFP82_09390 [Bacteroidota bacterium]
MDGVIVESEPIYRSVANRYFLDLGLEVSNEVYETFVGASNGNTKLDYCPTWCLLFQVRASFCLTRS